MMLGRYNIGTHFATIFLKERTGGYKMKKQRMKELVRILMGSSLYFDLTLIERRDLVKRLLIAKRPLC